MPRSSAAQSAAMGAFFRVAALPALLAARLKARPALLMKFLALLGVCTAESPMSSQPRTNCCATDRGTGWPTHAGLSRARSSGPPTGSCTQPVPGTQ